MFRPWMLTGVGVVSTAGDDTAAVFDRLLEGQAVPAVTPCEEATGTDPEPYPAVRIPDFDPRQYVKRKGFKLLSRTSQLACAAASLVREGLERVPAGDVGVVFGSAWASLDSVVRFEREAHTEGPRFVDPILFTETVANVPAGQVSIFFGWSAINATVSAGSASGLEALRKAVDFLGEGRADVIVAGGGDELNRHLLRTLHAEGLTADSPPSLPYSASGRGPVGSEGACLFTIESGPHAKARGARVLGRLIGGVGGFVQEGGGADTTRRGRMIETLLRDSGLSPGEVDLLVLSGNGGLERDRAEAALVIGVFGPDGPPAVAPKAVLGETWAASGPLGVVIALESMRRSVVPPNPVGLGDDPEFAGLRLSDRPVERSVRHALVLDCSESGQFTALVLAAGDET